jgi:hypothetical protein
MVIQRKKLKPISESLKGEFSFSPLGFTLNRADNLLNLRLQITEFNDRRN